MFDELRKKLANAVKSFIKTEEKSVGQEPKQEEVRGMEHAPAAPSPAKEPEKKESLVKLTLKTKIKSAFAGSVKLSDADIDKFLEGLRMSMLQSDVSYSAAEEFLEKLRTQLKEKPVGPGNIESEVTAMIRASLLAVLKDVKPIDVIAFAKGRVAEGDRPVKILFMGPNGTGKTTTIAKLAHSFKGMGMSCVLSASDTFRAAAIEQLSLHAEKIGVPVIKSTYGADPASVAFDAIAYAKAHGIDIVLIDSAGRQETNRNLIDEMGKMARVSKPDLVIFVGESTAGNVIAEQIGEFSKFVNIDGIILTKLDADAKGGGALSIAHTTRKPVLFFGTGQGYDALVPYSPEFVVNAIMPNG